VAGLLARELGWSVAEAAAQVKRYRDDAEAERAAASTGGD
jgi:hypothetical protein